MTTLSNLVGAVRGDDELPQDTGSRLAQTGRGLAVLLRPGPDVRTRASPVPAGATALGLGVVTTPAGPT